MKKTSILAVILLVIFCITGCGAEPTLEKKIAMVREAQTITTDDVLDLMKLEGLEVEVLTPSDVFKSKWPDAVLCKINGEHYFAMQSFENEMLYSRDKKIREQGWHELHLYGGLGDGVASQITMDYDLNNQAVYVSQFIGKNIVGNYIQDFYRLIEAYETGGNETFLEMHENYEQISNTIDHIFDNDINALKECTVKTQGEQITFEGALGYFQTPIEFEHGVNYDVYIELQGELQISDALLAQYGGEEYKYTLSTPLASRRTTHHSSELIESTDTIYTDNRDIGYKLQEEPIGYELIFTVGDYTETLFISSDDVVTE